MTLKLGCVAMLVVVMAATGCGSKKAAQSATTTTSAQTTTEAMTTGASTTATTSTNSGAPSFASAKNCRDLVALGRKFSEAFKTTANGSANLSNVADAYKSLASAAPAEIRSDFQTFANAFSDYAKALDKSGFKPGKTPTASQIAAITAASKEFSSPKLLTAERHLTAWGQQNCAGVTTTTG